MKSPFVSRRAYERAQFELRQQIAAQADRVTELWALLADTDAYNRRLFTQSMEQSDEIGSQDTMIVSLRNEIARLHADIALLIAQDEDVKRSRELIQQISVMAQLDLGGGRRRDGTFTSEATSKEAVFKLEEALVAVSKRIAERENR